MADFQGVHFCESIEKGFVAWGHIGPDFIATQAEDFEGLKKNLLEIADFLEGMSTVPGPFILDMIYQETPRLVLPLKPFNYMDVVCEVERIPSVNRKYKPFGSHVLLCDHSIEGGRVILPDAPMKAELGFHVLAKVRSWIDAGITAGRHGETSLGVMEQHCLRAAIQSYKAK